jgi:hypothetical protein
MACVGVEQRNHKARIISRGQGQHGKAVLKIRELALLFVRRQISRNKVNPAEAEFFRGSARHCDMAKMYRIKGSAKKSDLHAVIESAFA